MRRQPERIGVGCEQNCVLSRIARYEERRLLEVQSHDHLQRVGKRKFTLLTCAAADVGALPCVEGRAAWRMGLQVTIRVALWRPRRKQPTPVAGHETGGVSRTRRMNHEIGSTAELDGRRIPLSGARRGAEPTRSGIGCSLTRPSSVLPRRMSRRRQHRRKRSACPTPNSPGG